MGIWIINPCCNVFSLFIHFRNPGQDNIPTVGREFIKALVKTGYVDDSYLQSVKSMSQASRTDTGVSALRQLIVMDLGEYAVRLLHLFLFQSNDFHWK